MKSDRSIYLGQMKNDATYVPNPECQSFRRKIIELVAMVGEPIGDERTSDDYGKGFQVSRAEHASRTSRPRTWR